MTRSQLCYSLIETIREFQLQNRFALRAQSTALDLLGSRLLTEIETNPDVLASELSTSLALSPTVISRALAKLERVGFIRSRVAVADARARTLEITARGARELAEFDRQSDERLRAFQGNIQSQEYLQLQSLLARFANGFDLPVPFSKREEHALRADIRTVTQALGLLHGGVFGTEELGSPEWQALSLIETSPCPIVARDIAAHLRAPKNSISQLIGRLEKLQHIRRKQADHDKRIKYLTITEKGERALSAVRTAGATVLAKALQSFSTQEVQELVRLLNLFVGGSHTVLIDNKRLSIVRVTTPETLSDLRAFAVTQAGKQDRSDAIRSTFFPEDTRAYALYDGSALVACLEFQPGESSQSVSVQHWFHDSRYAAATVQSNFLQQCAKLVFSDLEDFRIEIPAENVPIGISLAGRFVKKRSAHVLQKEDLATA